MCVVCAIPSVVSVALFVSTPSGGALGPIPDSASYAYQALEMHRGNYFTIPFVGEVNQPETPGVMWPSRYPPGYSLALAPFASSLRSVRYANTFWTMVLVWVVALVAWRAGGACASALAVLMLALSPFIWFSARVVMSDVFGAALVLGVFGLMLELEESVGRRRVVQLAFVGVVTGYAVISRTLLAILPVALVLSTRRWRDLLMIAVALLPFGLGLAFYNWRAYGSPLMNGYDYWLPGLQTFTFEPFTWDPQGDAGWIYPDVFKGLAFRWTCPCAREGQGILGHTPPAITYLASFLGLYWVGLPPMFGLFGAYELWASRKARATQFAFVFIVLNFVLLLAFFNQGIRLFYPSLALTLVMASVRLAGLVARVAGVAGATPCRPRPA